MTQFKEKARRARSSCRAGLFTYPALMAADILLYDADRVPVGDDQRQHLELARDLAVRFNGRYGDTFVVPEAAIPKVGARIMDLQDPTKKMSKSDGVAAGHGPPARGRPRASSARSSGRSPTPRPRCATTRTTKPGVSNLLELLGAATGRAPEEVAAGYTQYGPLKADTADAVVELLRPVQERYAELAADPAGTAALLEKGAAKAQAVAADTLERAQRRIGLLPRS